MNESRPLSNGIDSVPISGHTSNHSQIHQLAINLPRADTTISLHLTNTTYTLVLLLANSTIGAPATPIALGSLVYALPNRNQPAQPLSTALYTRTSSVDFATRLARILARKMQKPVYVGGELKFWDIEDEAAALRAIVETVGRRLQAGLVNGDMA